MQNVIESGISYMSSISWKLYFREYCAERSIHHLLIVKQFEKFTTYPDEKCDHHESPQKNFVKMLMYINVQEDRSVKSCPNFTSEIKMCAAILIADSVQNRMAYNSHEVINKCIITCMKNIHWKKKWVLLTKIWLP